jgi:hypothetical protein
VCNRAETGSLGGAAGRSFICHRHRPAVAQHKDSWAVSELRLFSSLSSLCLHSQLGVSPDLTNHTNSVIIRDCHLTTDNQQYAAWNRTRRLRTSPYLARTDTNTSRMATALATAPSNVPPTHNHVEANSSEPPKEQRQENLFGPNIGIISDGPAWAQPQDTKKNTSSDYLTPEIVRRWVDASKEVLFTLLPLHIPADLIFRPSSQPPRCRP